MHPFLAAAPSFNIVERLNHAFVAMGDQIIHLVPKLLVAGILVLVGWLFARGIATIFAAMFEKSGMNRLLIASNVGGVLEKLGIKSRPGVLVGRILFWVIFLSLLETAADTAEMDHMKNVIAAIFSFLPNLFEAVVILVATYLVAETVRAAVHRALSAFGVDYAHSMASILFGFVFVMGMTVALSQVGIHTELLNATVKILVGGMAAAFALALGLGLKECAAAVVAGIYARDVFRPGTIVEMDGQSMEVQGVGPVTTKLKRADGGLVILPNVRLTGETLAARPAPAPVPRETPPA